MYIIDRFEGDIALLEENRNMIEVPRAILPADAKEGDCLHFDGERYILDKNATQERAKRIQSKMDALWN